MVLFAVINDKNQYYNFVSMTWSAVPSYLDDEHAAVEEAAYLTRQRIKVRVVRFALTEVLDTVG